MKILIIEDEIKAARELERILVSLDEQIRIVGIIDSVEDAVCYLSSNPQPDLIFSDIQLSDNLAFEIYKQVKVKCPIIFCTAFDEFMMEAFETNAVSYILKPINVKKVEEALGKFSAMKEIFRPSATSESVLMVAKQFQTSYKATILVDHRDKIIPISVNEISFLYLDKTIVHIYTNTQQRYYISSSLEDMERCLDPAIFYRANRQFLIGRHALANVERFLTRRFMVQLRINTPEPILISKAKSGEFLKWVEAG